MRVTDILRQKGSDVVTIAVGKTVHDAIGTLNEHGIGALIVIGESGEISGIITERDIMRDCGERCVRQADPSEDHGDCPALVEGVMTKDLVIGVPDDGVDYVMAVMTNNKIRHLPILEDGELAGIISIGDVVNAHVEEADHENRLLKDYIHGVG